MITEERYGRVLNALKQHFWQKPVKKIVRDIKGLSAPEIISRLEDLAQAGYLIGADGTKPITDKTYIELSPEGRALINKLNATK